MPDYYSQLVNRMESRAETGLAGEGRIGAKKLLSVLEMGFKYVDFIWFLFWDFQGDI